MKKKKVCFVITSPIHYSRNFLIIRELAKDPRVELTVLLGGSVLLSRFMSKSNNIEKFLKKDGVKKIYKMFFFLDGDEEVVKTKTTGLAVMEFADMFYNIKPDIVVVRGDRFEVLSAAIAAVYLNIRVAHIEGGDISGTIDESVRHAITKLSHLHFATNKYSEQRLIQMGENPKNVFDFGSPDAEVVKKVGNKKIDLSFIKTTGSLVNLDQDNFVMVMFHPVYTERRQIIKQTRALIKAVHDLDMSVLWFWPLLEPGSEDLAKELRVFVNETKDNKVCFSRYLPMEDFIYLLKKTKCLVGNSSAGIKECSVLGVPVVNIGSRQYGRLRHENIMDVDFDSADITKTIAHQIKKGRYTPTEHYTYTDTAKHIAKTIIEAEVDVQKTFYQG